MNKNDEFSNLSDNTMFKVDEYKKFEAVEYYRPKEIQNQNEDNRDSVIDDYNSQNEINTNKDETPSHRQELNEEQKKLEDLKSNSDGVNEGAQGGADSTAGSASSSSSTASTSSTATAESGATAAAETGATVAATSASLAGSVSVIAVGAVAVASFTGSVLSYRPALISQFYESGTDYIKYEINLLGIREDVTYKIKVSNNNFSVVYPVEQDGLQSQIIGGLIPNRRYDVQVLAQAGDLGEYVYYTHSVYTSKLDAPEAIFDFTPTIDYENGIYNLNYETYISDYFNVGYDTYLEIWLNDVKVVEDFNLPEDNFFRGTILNIPDDATLAAKVYTTYYDELTLIGSVGYVADYPTDFIGKNEEYQATYDIKPTATIGEDSFTVSIDTGFVSTDPRDGYIIDIYEAKPDTSLNANEEKKPLYSFEGKDKVFTTTIPINVSGIDIYYTGIKKTEALVHRYETKKVASYSFAEVRKEAPAPTAEISYAEDINAEEQTYNLKYDVTVTDKWLVGKNYELLLYKDNELFNTIPLTSLTYSGTLEDLVNKVKIKAIIKYKNSDNEELSINTDEQIVEYPADFVAHNDAFDATNDIKVNASVGDDKFELTINTNFLTNDSRDYYNIEIYNGNELIDRHEGNEMSYVVNIDPSVESVDIYYQGIKKTESFRNEYDKTKVMSYSFDDARKAAPNPVPTFEFSDDIIDDEFNVDYEITVVDKWNKAKSYYLEAKVDNAEFEIDPLSLTGKLENLNVGSTIKLSLYYIDKDEEQLLIKEETKIVEYPEDFIGKNEPYEATHEIGTEAVADTEEGKFRLTVNTNFASTDPRDQYIIRVYDGDTLIDTHEGTDQTYDVLVDPSVLEVQIFYQGIKVTSSHRREYENSIDVSYNFGVARSEAPDPTAEFSFSENIDEEESIYNLDYEIEVSDYWGKAQSYKVMLKVGEEEYDLDDPTKLSGTINNLDDGTKVTISLYYVALDQEEVLIEEKEYIVEYPEDFIGAYEEYEATHEIEASAVADASEGKFKLTINTNFASTDSRDQYIIKVYNGDTLLNTHEGTDLTYDILVDPSVSEVLIYYQGIKVTASHRKEYANDMEPSFSFSNARIKAPNPTAEFIYNENIDEDDIYNLDYEIEVSDHWGKASSYIVTIKVGEEEIDLDDPSKLTGTIQNLDNGTKVVVSLYYTIPDQPEVLIEANEYTVKYPDDFIGANEEYEATHELSADATIDTEKGKFKLTITTNFASEDPRDQYIITVYDGETLIDTHEGKDLTYDVLVDPSVLEVQIFYQGIKVTESKRKEYENTIDLSYNFIEVRKDAPEAEAVITFTPDVDETNEEYNMNYSVVITDKWHKHTEYYERKYYDDELLSLSDDLALTDLEYSRSMGNLANGQKVKIVIVYVDATGVEVEIGSKETTIEYPEGLVKFAGTYELTADDVSTTLTDDGYVLAINPNFAPANDNERYRIEAYDGEDLITSVESSEATANITIPYEYNSVTIKLVPYKERRAGNVEFEGTSIEYEIPLVFNNATFSIDSNSYSFGVEFSGIRNNTFNVRVTENKTTGDPVIKGYVDSETPVDSEYQFETSCSIEERDVTTADLSSIKVEIICGGVVLKTYTQNIGEASFTIGDIDVDSSGGIVAAYEIALPEGATLTTGSITINDGAEAEVNIDSLTGNLEISTISKNELSGITRFGYTRADGVEVTVALPVEINMEVSVEVDYHAFYVNSCFYGEFDFRTKLNEESVDADVLVKVGNEFKPISDYSTKDGLYYRIEDNSSAFTDNVLTYRIANPGFGDTEYTVTLSNNLKDDFTSGGPEGFDRLVCNPTYFTTENADGTVNYYFHPGVTYRSDNCYSRIVINDSIVTPYFRDGTYELLNQPAGYDAYLYVFYKDTGVTPNQYYRLKTGETESVQFKKATTSATIVPGTDSFFTDSDGKLNVEVTLLASEMTGSTVTFNINGGTYDVPLKASTDSGVTTTSDGYEYDYSGSDYSYSVEKNNTDGKWIIKLFKDSTTTDAVSITYSYKPSIASEFSDIINEESLTVTDAVDLMKFRGVFSSENTHMEEPYYSLTDGIYAYIQYKVNSEDSRDQFIIRAYYNDELIAETEPSSSAWKTIGVSFDYAGKTIEIKVVDVKVVYGETIYYDTHSLGTVELPNFTAFETYEVSGDGDSYTINATPNGYYSGSYTIKIVEHYSDSTDSEQKEFVFSGSDTIGKTITRTDMGTTKTAVSVDIEIYNSNGLLLSKQTKEF
ncbi:MAG: hypothetical protein IJU60_05930 [Acholeplasmatales bacterium]|nr:hypothetical protein [Acholeplasmatales bacterium]